MCKLGKKNVGPVCIFFLTRPKVAVARPMPMITKTSAHKRPIVDVYRVSDASVTIRANSLTAKRCEPYESTLKEAGKFPLENNCSDWNPTNNARATNGAVSEKSVPRLALLINDSMIARIPRKKTRHSNTAIHQGSTVPYGIAVNAMTPRSP